MKERHHSGLAWRRAAAPQYPTELSYFGNNLDSSWMSWRLLQSWISGGKTMELQYCEISLNVTKDFNSNFPFIIDRVSGNKLQVLFLTHSWSIVYEQWLYKSKCFYRLEKKNLEVTSERLLIKFHPRFVWFGLKLGGQLKRFVDESV